MTETLRGPGIKMDELKMKSMFRFLDGWLDDWRASQAERQTDGKIEQDIADVGNITRLSYL